MSSLSFYFYNCTNEQSLRKLVELSHGSQGVLWTSVTGSPKEVHHAFFVKHLINFRIDVFSIFFYFIHCILLGDAPWQHSAAPVYRGIGHCCIFADLRTSLLFWLSLAAAISLTFYNCCYSALSSQLCCCFELPHCTWCIAHPA